MFCFETGLWVEFVQGGLWTGIHADWKTTKKLQSTPFLNSIKLPAKGSMPKRFAVCFKVWHDLAMTMKRESLGVLLWFACQTDTLLAGDQCQHEIEALGLVENVQFCIVFWTPTSHMAAVSRCQCRGFISKKLSQKRRYHMAVMVQYTVSLCVRTQALLLKHTHTQSTDASWIISCVGGLSLPSFSSSAVVSF